MKELKCPNCGSVFSVDEADYASIVNQVKTLEFDAEVESRLKEIMKQNKIQQEADSMKISQKYQEQLNSKEIELSKNVFLFVFFFFCLFFFLFLLLISVYGVFSVMQEIFNGID